MRENSVQIGGAVVFWRLAPLFDDARLREGLGRLGYICPEPRSPLSAMRAALADSLPKAPEGCAWLIRPTAADDTLAVTMESEGQDRNSYTHELSAQADRTGWALRAGDGGEVPAEVSERFSAAYQAALGTLPMAAVSRVLVKITEGVLCATSLREAGGVYWLPGHRLDEYRALAEVIEAASLGKEGSALYCLSTVADADQARAVSASLAAEVGAEADRIDRELREEDLGARALDGRIRQIEALGDKIRLYEESLGVGMDRLRERMADVGEAAMRARILAAAAADAGQQHLFA